MKTKLAALVSLALVLSACSPAGSTGGDATRSPAASTGGATTLTGMEEARADVPRASAAPAAAASAAAAVNAFGLDVYRKVAAGTDNVVFSPASIALALGMARAGARGQTATEMDAVMHALGADANVGWLNALDQALAARSGTFEDMGGNALPVALRIANAPFAQVGMPLEAAYLEALAARYGAGLRLVDYVADTEGARKAINGWVNEQTEQRIPELLVPGVLTPQSRLTLVNAIYLKAPWLEPFAAEATQPGAFTRADGSAVEVPMMATGASMRHAGGTGWEAVEIPYIGGSLAMTVVVPDDLAAFEQTLTADQLASITGALEETQVSLTFPKFSIETKAELADVLAALGMPSAFDDRADFSGITTAEQLLIADVIHQANIDVDEKGTEAAAATAVVMRAGSMPAEPVTMRVDRPFLFALRDVPTGTVLFLGRVGDPSITR
jgi:serpin B